MFDYKYKQTVTQVIMTACNFVIGDIKCRHQDTFPWLTAHVNCVPALCAALYGLVFDFDLKIKYKMGY